MKAIVIGATGLIGSQLVSQLLENENFKEVVLFLRKKIDSKKPKLIQYEIDFNHLGNYKDLIYGDVLFSCLGTTIKKAKTKENQYLIDYHYQYNFSKIASENKVNKYVIVSSLGADKNSINFYSKMKGELEESIKKLDFKNIYIMQPSLLLGDRKEFRLGEKILIASFKTLSFMIPKKYKGIEDKIVAKNMIDFSLKESSNKINTIPNNILLQKKSI